MTELNEPYRMVIYDKWDRPLVEMKVGNGPAAVEIKTEYENPNVISNDYLLVRTHEDRYRIIVNVTSPWNGEVKDGILSTLRTYERIPVIEKVINTDFVPDEIKRYLIGGS